MWADGISALSAVPAILVGISESPQMAAYVALLFLGVQSVEGYVLEPLIQHRAVYLPPALILFAQLLLGLLAGPIGVIVATPFAAAFVVAVFGWAVNDGQLDGFENEAERILLDEDQAA